MYCICPKIFLGSTSKWHFRELIQHDYEFVCYVLLRTYLHCTACRHYIRYTAISRKVRGTQLRFSPKYIENTFQATHSTFSSNRRYEIYICSVILGQLESFRNYQGFSIIFPKILDERRRENFSDSSFHRIFESENFRFSFSAKNSLIWRGRGIKCQTLNPCSENRREFIR